MLTEPPKTGVLCTRAVFSEGPVKRALAVVVLALIVATLLYGYTMTRRERVYRRAVLEGELSLARGDTFGALSHFDEAISLKPDAMLGYLKRGEAHFRRGDLDAAAEDFAVASARDQSASRALELRGDVDLARQRPEQAADHFTAFVRLDDRAPGVFYKLGLARLLMGQPVEAAEALTRAVGLDARLADAHYLLGICYREMQRPRDAQRSLERAISLAPGLVPAREQLADFYAAAGNRAGRIRQLEALFEADPRAGRQLALAAAYADANQTTRAVRLLGHATERYPDHADAYVALGRLWFDEARNGDYVALGKSVEALEHAAAMEPTSKALGLLGEAQLMSADPTVAENILQQAAEKLPADRATYLHLADAAERAGNPDHARRALADYYSLCPPTDRRRGDIARRIADLSLRVKDQPAAVIWYANAATSYSAPSDLLDVARAQMRMADKAGAIVTLNRLLERDPENDVAKALRAIAR
jgi:tetratricopeptide (TPR) repeat protein